MKCEIEKKDGCVHVRASIAPASASESPRSITTADVLAWLKENHPRCKVGETLKSCVAMNSASTERCHGHWIFELKDASVSKPQKGTKNVSPITKTKPSPATAKKTVKSSATNG